MHNPGERYYQVDDLVQVVWDDKGDDEYIGYVYKISHVNFGSRYPYGLKGLYGIEFSHDEVRKINLAATGNDGTIQINIEPEQSELDKKFKGIIDRKFYKKT